MKCSVQPFGAAITDNCETSKYTGYKAGQCSALLSDFIKCLQWELALAFCHYCRQDEVTG